MTNVLDKVRKLMRLAESPNANEAALAAAKAQELIDEHNLSATLLELDRPSQEQEPDEPIEDFQKKGAPLYRHSYIDRWRSALASTIARHNGCKIYLSGGTIQLIGRPSDADTVRYLYGYLQSEVERLCNKEGKGCGATWRNNYRLGVVDTISRKLATQHANFIQNARSSAPSQTALVRVNQALARIEQRRADVEAWTKTNKKLYSRGSSRSTYDPSARDAGRRAGQSINLNRASGSLTAGGRKLIGG